MADFTAGDIRITKLELISHKGEKFDLLGIWASVEIFEDMLDSAITARVFILDGINLFERFPIIGHERLIVHYCTPGMETVKIEMVSFDIPERAAHGDNVFGYYINCMTEDGMKARTTFVTNPSRGNPLDAIKSILSNSLGSTRSIAADDLINDLTYIPPRQRPFEAINTICNRSFSSIAAESPDVIFYDTVDGYRVKSLYGLMQEPIFAKYSVADSAVFNDKKTNETTLYNIGNYSMTSSVDVLARINGGSYGGTLGVFDVVRRKYTEKKYGITTSPENFSILNNNTAAKVSADLIKAAQDSNFRYVMAGTKDHTLLERTARLDQLFGGVRMVVDLPGNSDLRVGQVLYVSAPSPTPSENGKDDKTVSGKYLISSIRHSIVRNNVNGYRSVAELVKDSSRLKI